MNTIITDMTAIRKVFFNTLFAKRSGFFSVASVTEAGRIAKPRYGWREKYFWYPDDLDKALKYIDQEEHGRHVWFSVHLMDKEKRHGDFISTSNIVWADLDTCHPDTIKPTPPIVIESSPGRYQCVWILEVAEPIPAILASEYSRRFAYKYVDAGVDKSGADLTQLLRVPGTYNYKTEYTLENGEPPKVNLVRAGPEVAPSAMFEAMPPVPGDTFEWEDKPELLDPDDVIKKYGVKLTPTWHHIYQTTPDRDWSKVLWRFIQSCFEVGMDKQEAFSVAAESACNKFKRDGYRPDIQLWGDVLRAHSKFLEFRTQMAQLTPDKLDIPPLYDPAELPEYESFVDRYFVWASSLGDAAAQYHELSGFIILSGLLSGNLQIEASIGNIVPIIWGMILGDTTMTRKTTAMDTATDLLEAVPGFEDIVLATDGSYEGIFKSIARQPGKPAIYKMDEIQGFMATTVKKDYMAGMMAGLTKLYDCKNLKRQLSKETITVNDPRLILYGGGIKTKMMSELAAEHVESGFLPRFFFVSAEQNPDGVKGLGPRTEANRKEFDKLLNELTVLKQAYVDYVPVAVGGSTNLVTHHTVAEPTEAAYVRYNEFEQLLLRYGYDSQDPALYTPMLNRFSISTLKCATLLAAQRQEPQYNKIKVEASDIVKAISHTSKWLPYMIELMSNLGNTVFEQDLIKVLKFVTDHQGCPSGAVMRNYKFSAKQMANILDTLEGRGLIDIRTQGKGKLLWTIVE